MKNLFYLLLFFIIINCSTDKEVYWCGDRPCVNKKDRENYFKETMIVEIKELKKTSRGNSEMEQIMQQAGVEQKRRIVNEKVLSKESRLEEKRRIKKEKNIIKHAKLEEKRRIKKEKNLIKQAKLEERRRIKEEKELVKQIERDEKKMIKSEKKLAKQTKHDENKIIKKEKEKSKPYTDVDSSFEDVTTDSNIFKKLVEKITKENILKPYPDINNIPN